jgi:transforming growth factor-beta-induced protein
VKYLRSVWTFGLLGLLLAACSSADPPPTDAITTQAVEVSYTLEVGFAAFPRGDVNRDRRITGADLGIVNSAIRSGRTDDLSDFQRYQADYNCDGILNIDDIRGIQARQRNDKAPAEAQVCEGDDGLVLISNVGDLPFNNLQVTATAGIRVVLEAIEYFTVNPTTFAYTITVTGDVSSGSLIISAGNIDTLRVELEDVFEVGNIAEVVASRPDLSILLEAVLEAGLADALTADGELTVFAPNNEAFVDFLARNDTDSLAALIEVVGIENFSELLQFHIVPGALSAADLLALINDNGGGIIGLETITGGGLTVSLVDGNVVLQDDNTVIEANIEASNGIIHVIDGVVTFFEDPLKIDTIALGETVTGALEPTDNYGLSVFDEGATIIRDYRDDYELVGIEAGQTVTVTLESDVFEPFIVIISEFGFVNASVDGTLTFVYDPEVTLLISVQAGTLGELGTYSLTVTEADTIADIATATPDLSSLVGALNAEQVALLSDPTEELTVFAPLNTAFEAASDLLATLTPEQIATVIDYHVVAGVGLAEDIVALDGDTLPDTDIVVSVTETGIFLQGAGNDAPVQIIDGDIEASNGVVHLLDGILLPAGLIPDEPALDTIAEIATATPDLSSLVGSLNADQAALLSDETQALTVLAPVNSAFAAASDLLATLSAEQVATVINYHVLAGEFLAADVVALDGQTLPGSDITVSVTEAGVFLQGAGNDAPIQVIQTDIDASNGVVHLLDGILLPAELPGITTFEVMLEGGQQNPPVTTDGMGSVAITLNEDTSVMTLTGSVSNLSSPLFDVNPDIGSVHIHEAPRGENGPVIFPIDVERTGDGTSATLSLTATLTNEQVSTLQAGGYYINVHTENFNGGEIRGQIE